MCVCVCVCVHVCVRVCVCVCVQILSVFLLTSLKLCESNEANEPSPLLPSSSPLRPPPSVHPIIIPSVYKLSEISFKALEEIPRHLLESIAYCFCQKKEVCRKCFYGDRSLSSWLQEENVCSLSQHKWMNPILVIPGEGVRM